MQLFRAITQKYITTPFSAYGAAKLGGRWNSTGVAVLYTSESFELALSEKLYGSELITFVKKRHANKDVKDAVRELIQGLYCTLKLMYPLIHFILPSYLHNHCPIPGKTRIPMKQKILVISLFRTTI